MSILVATPCYGGNVTDLYFRSVLDLTRDARERGVTVDVLTVSGESLITRARNDIFARFLEGEWSDLLFIDADLGFSSADVWRLLDSEWDVCAAPYPLKRFDWDAVSLASTGAEAREFGVQTVINYQRDALVDADGFAPALDVGTGFMRVSRHAAEVMRDAHPHLHYRAEGGRGDRWAVFDTMLFAGRYLSEDYAFCRRWQLLGGRVMVDTSARLVHRGVYEFGGV